MPKEDIVIKNVIKGSIADEVGIEKNDLLLKINGNDVKDIIEYRYLISDEYIEVLIRKPDGEEWEIEIEKDFEDDLGIEFDDPIMAGPQRCHNKCVFCFIDQLPKGMRESLYFKDDDSRLSFLQGNFVTLTNMSDEDIDRIIMYRISPINVSVHTTNPELRIKMLNNKNAGNILERIRKLVQGGISINCQIVLCPGINDGEELKRTIYDLLEMYPFISNIAIVPIGVTRYRERLHNLKVFDRESAAEIIEFVEGIQRNIEKRIHEPFARLADEFYVMAENELPPVEHYGDFEQLEDGIGMLRYFESRVLEDLESSDFDGKGSEAAFLTGASSSNFIKSMAEIIEKKLNVKINVYTISNDFFGSSVTVTGLITAKDIINQLRGVIKEKVLFIPSSILKADEDIFLDDITLDELQTDLNVKVVKCKYTGDDLVEKITNEVI